MVCRRQHLNQHRQQRVMFYRKGHKAAQYVSQERNTFHEFYTAVFIGYFNSFKIFCLGVQWNRHINWMNTWKFLCKPCTDLLIFPNREKIISRSSAVVTGLSLHTNSTFSGGAASTSGRSPTCTC